MTKATILAMALILLAGGDLPSQAPPVQVLPASVRFLQYPARIPLVTPARLPVVRARVGHSVLNLVLDTGASGLILFRSTVTAGRLVTRSASLPVEIGAGPALHVAEICHLDTVGLLDDGATRAILHDVYALVVERGPVLEEIPTHGVLGAGALATVLLVLDIAQGHIELSHGALPPPDGSDVLPLNLRDLSIDVVHEGQLVRFMLDSGFDGAVLLPERVARAFSFSLAPVLTGGVQTGGGWVVRRSARLADTLWFGRYALDRPIVDLVPRAIAPLLGVEALRHFRITLDQSHGRVRFLRDGAPSIEAPPLVQWGFATTQINGSCVVMHVDPASPAHAAGLRPGDEILEAGGQSPPGLTTHHWDTLLRGCTDSGVPVLIARDDVLFRVPIRLQMMVP